MAKRILRAHKSEEFYERNQIMNITLTRKKTWQFIFDETKGFLQKRFQGFCDQIHYVWSNFQYIGCTNTDL